jgi:hypothetical protein
VADAATGLHGVAERHRQVVNVQITDFKEATMEDRMLASATTAGWAFDLR